MRPQPSHITRSYQFFSAALRLLGEDLLRTIWGRSTTQVYRWGADPARCDDVNRNPIDLLSLTLERMQELGRDDIVEGALRVLITPLGYDVRPKEIFSDKGATGETFDVNIALGKVSEMLSECLADRRIDEDERERLMPVVAQLVRQASELLDAINKRRV